MTLPTDRVRRSSLLAACIAAALFAAILSLPSSANASSSASKPSGLAAALVDATPGDEYDGVVTLTWNAPAQDASSVTGYQILRRQPGVDAVGAFHTLVDNTSTSDTSYTDLSANDPGAAYTYRVKAWRDTDLSGRSRWTRIDLPASYTPPPADTVAPPDTTPPDTVPPVTVPPDTTTPPVTVPPDTTTPPVTVPPDTTTPPVTVPPDTTPPPVTVPPVVGESSVKKYEVNGGDTGNSGDGDKTVIQEPPEVVAKAVVDAPDNPPPARADLNPCSLSKHSSKYWCTRSAFRKYLAPIDLRMTYNDQGYTQIGWDNPPMKPLTITSYEVQHSTDRGNTWTQIADYTGSHPHEVVFKSPHPRECRLNRYRVRAVYGSDGQSPWKTANVDAEQLRPGYQVPPPRMNYSVAATVSTEWFLNNDNTRFRARYNLSPQWGDQPSCASAEIEWGSIGGTDDTPVCVTINGNQFCTNPDGSHALAPTDTSWGWGKLTHHTWGQVFSLDDNGDPELPNPDRVAFVVGARVRFTIGNNVGPWRYVFWRWGRQTSGNFQVRRALALDFYRDLPDYDPFT